MAEDDCTLTVKVASLTVDPFTSLPVVILRDDLDRTSIPISIGLSEASSIAAELDEIDLERPMTHQLMSDMLGKAGVCVERVLIRDVVDNTFFATVYLALPCGQRIAQDARPSDALALALRCGAEIQVASLVLRKLARIGPSSELVPVAEPWPLTGLPPHVEDGTELLEGLGDEAFGKWKN